MGFEPTALCLGSKCSAPELRPHAMILGQHLLLVYFFTQFWESEISRSKNIRYINRVLRFPSCVKEKFESNLFVIVQNKIPYIRIIICNGFSKYIETKGKVIKLIRTHIGADRYNCHPAQATTVKKANSSCPSESNTPRLGATPLPPLNFRKIGQLWHIIEVRPIKICWVTPNPRT